MVEASSDGVHLNKSVFPRAHDSNIIEEEIVVAFDIQCLSWTWNVYVICSLLDDSFDYFPTASKKMLLLFMAMDEELIQRYKTTLFKLLYVNGSF